MNRLLFVLFIVLCQLGLPQICSAERQLRIAILPLENQSKFVDASEIEFISEIIRGVAGDILSASKFAIMTQENIFEMIPEDRPLVDCIGECAVETGRMIGADYIVVGSIRDYSGQLRIACSLYRVDDANLLISEFVGGNNLIEMENTLVNMCENLFIPLTGDLRAVGDKLRKKAIVIQSKNLSKKKTVDKIIWASSTAAFVYSSFCHIKSSSAYDDYLAADNVGDMNAAWNDHESYSRNKSVGLISGGSLLAWQLWRMVKGVPTEEEIYQDLLEQDRLSFVVQPETSGSWVIAFIGGF